MKEFTVSTVRIPNLFKAQKEKSVPETNWYETIMSVCFSLAVTLSGFGLTLSGMAYFGFVQKPESVNEIGTWLMVIAVPFYFIAAKCLEKVDLKQK